MSKDNPLLRAYCTKCLKNGMECECSTFYPNVIVNDDAPIDMAMIERMLVERQLGVLILTREDCRQLMKFFHDDGYISHEFHSETHKIIHRIEEFLR